MITPRPKDSLQPIFSTKKTMVQKIFSGSIFSFWTHFGHSFGRIIWRAGGQIGQKRKNQKPATGPKSDPGLRGSKPVWRQQIRAICATQDRCRPDRCSSRRQPWIATQSSAQGGEGEGKKKMLNFVNKNRCKALSLWGVVTRIPRSTLTVNWWLGKLGGRFPRSISETPNGVPKTSIFHKLQICSINFLKNHVAFAYNHLNPEDKTITVPTAWTTAVSKVIQK